VRPEHAAAAAPLFAWPSQGSLHSNNYLQRRSKQRPAAHASIRSPAVRGAAAMAIVFKGSVSLN